MKRLLSMALYRAGAGQWSIGAKLLSITAALTLIIGVLAGVEIKRALARADNLATLERVTAATALLLRAAEALAFERDVAASALNERDAASRSLLRQNFSEARQRSIEASRAAMFALDFEPGIAPLRRRIGERLSRIEEMRGAVERELAGAGNQSGNLTSVWIAEIDSVIEDADVVWRDLVAPHSDLDAVATQQLRFNRRLAAIYDESGRERSLVAGILAQNRTPHSIELAQMNRAQGALNAGWASLQDLALQGGFGGDVARDLSDARSQYEALHDMLASAFYGPDAGAGTLPIGSALWLELSDQQLQSLDTLRASVRAALAGRLTLLRHAANRTVLMQIAVLAFAFLLCTLCFLVVLRTVIAPIRKIVSALAGASRGEITAVPYEAAGRRDEIGQLIDVLHAFQQQHELVRTTAAHLDAGERRLRAVVNNAVDGVATIDERGRIESFNPACERLFDYRAAEIIGLPAAIILPSLFDGDPNAPDEPQQNSPVFVAASALETIARRRDGALIPVELTLSDVNLADASLLLAVVRDITPRKQAEVALRGHAEALERSNKELDDFAYIASHDLKEPLRGLHNHARFLLEDNGEKLDSDSVRRLNRLVALSQRMERLVNDLLYFSRLGRQDLAVQSVDLNAVIRDIEGTLDHFLAENHGRIVLPSPLPTVTCDAPRVSELFRNLITNAIKYNDKADRWIEIGAARDRVSPSGALCRQVFYVKDNGVGIAPEFHQEVFRIFKRLKGSAAEAEGTGVGLTFVKKIVERHGGEIWIESVPGEGTSFFFTLESHHDARAKAAA